MLLYRMESNELPIRVLVCLVLLMLFSTQILKLLPLFVLLISGYMCLSELVQFLEDAFIVLKRALLNATSHPEKIGALYLMYTMYFKQPPKQYCKFRMTMSDWTKMNQFYNEVCIFHRQASLIFWKLLQNDAFR